MKINHSQSNKGIIKISQLLFDKKPIIKNSSYYTKLYSPKQEKVYSKRNSLTSKTIQPNKSPKSKTLILKKIFNNKTNSRNLKVKWPKITHTKWPFSTKRTEPKELKQIRLLSSIPSSKYHNFNTIKWLSKKYSDSIKEKSIYSLLPNNGKPIIPEYENEFNKRHRQMMEYLESFHGPGEREKFVNINPKYFYDNTTFKKILKLKEMFIEFDKKGNHKLIIKEIVNLFKKNNIKVDANEIKELFFKNIKFRNKQDKTKNLLYLNFYQFMNFALRREQDFRQFMRNVKKKNKLEENNDKNNNYQEEKKNHIYIPMNFNLIFDYLINKEKQRNSIEIVENAIKEMDKIILMGNDDNKIKKESEISKKEINKENESLKKKYKTSKTFVNTDKNYFNLRNYHKTNTSTIKEEHENLITIKNANEELKSPKSPKSTKKISPKISTFLNKEKEEKLKQINFAKLIKEFSSLFGIKDDEEVKETLEKDKRIPSATNSKSFISKKYSNYFMNKSEEMTHLNKPEKSFTEKMKNQIRINSLKNINNNNFEKYHDLKLALNATKEEIKQKKNLTNLIGNDDFDIRDILFKGNYLKSEKINSKDSSKRLNKNIVNNFIKSLKNEHIKGNKKFRIYKPIYNFYLGKPQILNIDDDYYLNKKKYDYVPIEFLTSNNK